MASTIRALVLVALAAAPGLARAGEPDPFAGLRFLVGDWTGKGGGKPGEGAGACSFVPDLGGKVIVRRNVNEVATQPGAKPARTRT